jgi:hypothetical protein
MIDRTNNRKLKTNKRNYQPAEATDNRKSDPTSDCPEPTTGKNVHPKIED